jgi:hypothetical protein
LRAAGAAESQAPAGFETALAKLPLPVLRAVATAVRGRLAQAFAQRLGVDGFIPLGCDGSRLTCPRSQELERRLGLGKKKRRRRLMQAYAAQALVARQQVRSSRRRLGRLVRGRPVLEAQTRVVGGSTACVLWASVCDPRDYPCGEAYRKAMGLNLTERSSGTRAGQLHISKRGNPGARQWLYLAALRLAKQAGVRQWYEAKKGRDGQEAKGALVGVMRKLALALYRVGPEGATFEAGRLFPGRRGSGPQPESAKG